MPQPITLSQRLAAVAAFVPPGARLADIGSEHAYLPVALLQQGIATAAVAGERALTPLRAAQHSVAAYGLGERIQVRHADGLAAITPHDGITVVTLCGMGGETIRDILQAGLAHLNGQERLILQPNGGEAALREWLMHAGYRLVAETLLREHRFDYEILVAERTGPVRYDAQELYFGPLLMHERSPAFISKWQRLRRQKQRTLANLANLAKARQAEPVAQRAQAQQQLAWIEAVLAPTP